MPNTFLARVKLALRIVTNAFDTEIQGLIDDCLSELTMLGIYDGATMSADEQIISTVIYYCKARFGEADDGERWEKIYRSKLDKLMIARPYGGRDRS